MDSFALESNNNQTRNQSSYCNHEFDRKYKYAAKLAILARGSCLAPSQTLWKGLSSMLGPLANVVKPDLERNDTFISDCRLDWNVKSETEDVSRCVARIHNFFFLNYRFFLFSDTQDWPLKILDQHRQPPIKLSGPKNFMNLFSPILEKEKRKRVDKLFFGLIGFSCSIDFNKYCLN